MERSDSMNWNEKEMLQQKINAIPAIVRLFFRRGILSLGFIFETLYIISNTQPYQRLFYVLTLLCFAIHLFGIIFLYRKKLDISVEEYDELWMQYPKKMKTEIMIIAIAIILLIGIRFVFTKVLI